MNEDYRMPEGPIVMTLRVMREEELVDLRDIIETLGEALSTEYGHPAEEIAAWERGLAILDRHLKTGLKDSDQQAGKG